MKVYVVYDVQAPNLTMRIFRKLSSAKKFQSSRLWSNYWVIRRRAVKDN